MSYEQLYRECVSVAKSLADDAHVILLPCNACGVRVLAGWGSAVQIECHATCAHDALTLLLRELFLHSVGWRRAPGGRC